MHSFRVYWISFYMFRTVFSFIIRSSRLYIQHQVYVILVSWLLASGHAAPACKQCDIYLILYVQSWTPDDERKDRPKHVEWYSINSKNVHIVGFTIEIFKNTSRQKVYSKNIDNLGLNTSSFGALATLRSPFIVVGVDVTSNICIT
jgi:hypothetical protein